MKHTTFSIVAILAGTAFSLTIPGILPDPTSIPDAAKKDPSSLKLGCIASIAIGFMFASLLLVWICLVIYYGIDTLLHPRIEGDEEEIERRRKKDVKLGEDEEEEEKSSGNSYRAGPILGTIFGVAFAL
ncbi:hypothetical protein ONS95_001950 [Cadophora gregata]|uniref:uncharacterized protein n=1 Tax=Cadophora gregata TaxID=51156 RepID=UPI0026DD3924|nr:uncharacterized protein ONS95_001950 [Cadophora gregata]KAK0111602.1 hypothetical protein ONS95_001950 [Cadophora gregata]KAK0111920.1 hypothetical protein ONS96_001187 [Cadophora gregata f. sp. sojae]